MGHLKTMIAAGKHESGGLEPIQGAGTRPNLPSNKGQTANHKPTV